MIALSLLLLSTYFLWQLKQFNSRPTPTLIPTPTISTTGITISKRVGTSIIYTSSIPYTFPGSGLVEKKTNDTYNGYIVGTFAGIEKIPSTDDIYVLLKDPISNHTYRIRTLWSSSQKSKTIILQENINKIKAKQVDRGYIKKLGLLSDHISTISKGTLLIAMLDTIKENDTSIRPVLDKNFNYVTSWLIKR